MKVREHRGGLAEAMGTMVEIEPTMSALLQSMRESFKGWPINVTEENVHVEPYGFDDRIGWDTYIITIDGYGVYGFSDGPIQEAIN